MYQEGRGIFTRKGEDIFSFNEWMVQLRYAHHQKLYENIPIL